VAARESIVDRSQVEAIFHEALQHSREERESFLRRACGGDAALYREVTSLLVNHDETGEGERWAADAAARLVATQPTLEPGALFGHYRIERFLAAGGMGQVYRARDTRLDRVVALKVLSPELASDPHFRERFHREARVISQLDHAHICTLYDVGEENGRSFLVMQYLEGETLEQRLTRGSIRRSCAGYRWRMRWPRRIARGSSTAISSPATSC
jgi:serine/threonine protein kinase